ncbi:MAG: major capsid protein [Oscillospiraceae bacterium]|nr:major capsid protein [Oscillospiraceae bacterium]
MTIYDTLYMLAAVEEIAPEQNFYKSRYFPTNQALDVFGTSKVLIDYKENNHRAAPFVMPRIGALPVGRDGFSTYELEPAYIGVSKPLTLDHLTRRGFGESILSTKTPADRANALLMSDLKDLGDRITRTEEYLACQTMLDNGTVMRHQSDDPDVYEDVEVKFYDSDDNPALYTPSEAWTHTVKNDDGTLTVGNWYYDIINMVKMLTHRGRPATDLIVSNDVGNFLQEDYWILSMMDNRRSEYGALNPQELTPYVTQLGSFNFGGRRLNILVNDGTFEAQDGTETPYLDEGSAIVTAPDCGKGLYGAVTQLETDGQFHTYAGERVPQHIFTIRPPVKEVHLVSRPLFVPKTSSPWTAAKDVFGTADAG